MDTKILMSVSVRFMPDDIIVEAKPGESLLLVARRAGITIPTGCLMGSCHACEVEIEGQGPVCSCLTSTPSQSITVQLYSDPTW